MARPETRKPPVPPSLDGATPTGDMVLTGVVRTTKGFAVARAVITKDGDVKVTLGNSQTYKEYVAAEHKRVLIAATQRA